DTTTIYPLSLHDALPIFALKDLNKIMDIKGEPELQIVTKLKNSMPNYNVGHKEMIDGIQNYMEENYPGVHLIGASHYAVGLHSRSEEHTSELQSRFDLVC